MFTRSSSALLPLTPDFIERGNHTALPGWRIRPSRRPALDDCSLVVPASDSACPVGLLDALLAIPDPPAEVVIVDAGPSRHTGARLRDWAARSAAPFDLLYVAGPPELTRRRNVGIDISTRDFLFFLDPGMQPLPGYFGDVRRVFDIDRDRCVGGVTGVVIGAASRQGRDLSPFAGLHRVDALPGCASAWRREVFGSQRFSCYFGAFPEGEHAEMSRRAGLDWTLLACGEARVRRVSQARALGFDAGRAAIRNRCFIWRRHVLHPGRRNTARFWLRASLDVLASVRPWSLARIAHAAGMLAGIASCVIAPPAFTEPPARREYVLAADHLAAHTAD